MVMVKSLQLCFVPWHEVQHCRQRYQRYKIQHELNMRKKAGEEANGGKIIMECWNVLVTETILILLSHKRVRGNNYNIRAIIRTEERPSFHCQLTNTVSKINYKFDTKINNFQDMILKCVH